MLNYWHKRVAVRLVMADGGNGKDFSLVFASNSTPEQWSSQGDNFRKKHLWEQAILCYEKAGVSCAYLVKEAYAYHYIQEARQQKPQLFHNAALSFFERDELNHSVHCLNGAALCLKNSRPPKHLLAAKLFEKLGDRVKAAQCFLRGRDFENFARIQESQGEYNSVIKSLQGKPFMRKREALAKADEYEKKGYKLDPKFTPSELSFSCAKFYSERKDKKVLLEVLKYMPEQEKRAKFLKEASLFKEAFGVYAASKQYNSAYRLASAQGNFGEALSLARQSGDKVTEAKFVLLKAKFYYLTPQTDMSSDVIGELKEVAKSPTSGDEFLQAEANLLLGMLLKSQVSCIRAFGRFKLLKHKAGILEAFDQLGKFSDQEVLNCCHVAKKASATLTNANDMNIDVKQAVKLYGLQLIGKVYFTSPNSNLWIEHDTLLKCVSEDAAYDIDGMMRLKYDVRYVIATRYKAFISKWLEKSKLKSRLQQNLHSFKLHPQLLKRYLNRQYSQHEVSSLSMREYLQVCVHILELLILMDDTPDGMIAHILAIFSPQVYVYLPQCLNDLHLQTVRSSENSRGCFRTWIESNVKDSEKELEKVMIDEWLFVWRASCIALPSMKVLLEKISFVESKVNEMAEDKDYVPPPGYIYWKQDKRYCHIFSLWLNSCIDLREKSRALWAAKLTITHFLGKVAEEKKIFISVMNCVDILSIHCTSLLAMITHTNALQNYSTTFTVPLMYKHLVQLFSYMNCRKGTSDKGLLAACGEQVSSYRNLRDLFYECKRLLIRSMGFLIGTHPQAPWFSMLKVGLQKVPWSDATRFCLILTLTLFGNLAMLKVWDLKKIEEKIFGILRRVISKNIKLPPYVSKVSDQYEASCKSPNFSRPALAFSLVAKLLRDGKMDNTLSKLIFKQRSGHVEFVVDQPTNPTQVKKPSTSNVTSKKLPTPSTAELDRSSQQLIQPPLELGAVAPISPPTAPIGSERRQASGLPSSSEFLAHPHPVEMNPSLVSSLNPGAPSYLPGLPNSSIGSSVMQPPLASNFQEEGYFSASSVDFTPLGHTPNESNPNAFSAVHPQLPLEHFNTFESSGLNVPSTTSVLQSSVSGITPSASGFTLSASNFTSPPDFAPPTSDLELSAPNFTPFPPDLVFSASEFSAVDYGTVYNFQEDSFYFSEQQDELGAYTEADYGEVYGLTQQRQPVTIVDPMMVEGDIVDKSNNFCNVCGINYQNLIDDVIESEDYDNDRPVYENYHAHVTGKKHHDNTVEFKQFRGELLLGVDSVSIRRIDLAEEKLKECKERKADSESEQWDQVIDALQDQTEKYNIAVAEYEESRKWQEGIKAVSAMNLRMDQLLKETNDKVHKLVEVSRLRNERYQDDDDEMDEIDELSARYDTTLDSHVKVKGSKDSRKGDEKMRTIQEKQTSRDKKRLKRKTNKET